MYWISSLCSCAGRITKVCLPTFYVLNRKQYMSTMPPIDVSQWVGKGISSAVAVVFSKTTCPYCAKLKNALAEKGIRHATVELDTRPDGKEIITAIKRLSNISTVPQMFVRGAFVGDSSESIKKLESGELQQALDARKYEYDLVVIGGGSGGLAASKEAVQYGAKVAVLDYVEPTPSGTTWGLGGTCVNVGCIPKKLMHQAALLHHGIEDASHFGWIIEEKNVKHSWSTMTESIQDHIGSLNWGYKVALRTNKVTYLNAKGKLVNDHEIEATSASGKVTNLSAETIILATGERPKYPDIPGAKEHCITSDDLFSLPYHPGKTLVVGASYVALECAGFLATMGKEVTVMVRSILLRGFDQQMANMIGDYMEKHNVRFVRPCVPTEIQQLEPIDLEQQKPGRVLVTGKYDNGETFSEEFNTVLFAIGRDPLLEKMNVNAVNMKLDKAGRAICTEDEGSSVPNIYVIGDVNAGKPQLTPVAIQAGRYLAKRLYALGTELTDYTTIATTVFTPLEYGACGLSEEDAIQRYGEKNIEVYHSHFKPLEWTVAHREDNICYAKLVCLKTENDRVLGIHVLSPNAGEIMQGYAVALKIGATKADFDRTIGIHPTCSEIFTTLTVTKRSGKSPTVTGC